MSLTMSLSLPRIIDSTTLAAAAAACNPSNRVILSYALPSQQLNKSVPQKDRNIFVQAFFEYVYHIYL